MDEFELIRRYFTGAGRDSDVVVGVGDDGAVFTPTPGMEQVSVIDTLVEGVHFPRGMNASDVGYRVVAVNLSDIAAMGARPRWMTLALSLPTADESWLGSFAEGLHYAAAEHGVALVGGDTTRAEQLVVSVQITGEVGAGKALLRSGAQVGDTVYVTGTLGDAAAGLHGLINGDPVKELLFRFARPSPRVALGQALLGVASAAIDLSDGLYGDLRKLLFQSGVGADIDIAKLPLSDALREHFGPERQQSFALGGGDDYELCFTSAQKPPDVGIVAIAAIGTVTDGTELRCIANGEVVPFDDSGYRHFQ